MSMEEPLSDGWTLTALGDCTTRITDGTHIPPTFTDEGVPFLFVKHIVGGTMSFEGTRFISQNAYDELYRHIRIEKGDILYTAVGSYGVAVPVLTDEPFSFQRHIAHIKPHRELNQRYLVHFLNSQYGLSQAHRAARGVAQKTVTLGDLRKFVVRLAPVHEQSRIVAVVDELLSDLDAGVAALVRARANLKKYRAAVLKAAVTGELTADWRATHPNVEPATKLLDHILTERRQKWEANQQAKFTASGKSPPKDWQEKYPEPVGPDLTDAPPVPEGWCLASLDQLSSTITSGSRDWSQYYGQGSGTFLMAQNVRLGALDLTYRQVVGPPAGDRDRLRSQVLPDDLLVTIVGANTGDMCRVPRELPEHYVCQSVALIRPTEPSTSKYLIAYFQSPEHGQKQFRRYIYGAGRPHLGFDELRMTPVLLPTIAEQDAIVSEVEQALTVIAATENYISASLKRAARLRQSILKEAFAGRLVPQDPADEPASVLLARLPKSGSGVHNVTRRRKERTSIDPSLTSQKSLHSEDGGNP